LTSRDETPITLGFSELGNHYEDVVLHDIREAVTEYDNSLFLKNHVAKIRGSLDWPGDKPVQAVVTMSVQTFVTAVIVCRFLEDQNWDPQARLTELFED
jgi:hypothetical protein